MSEKIKITFLGTGSAIPTKKRNHTGILLRYKEQNILFDCGEGIQRQLRIAGLNPCKITKIFISHWHGDHFLGLAGLLQTLEMNDYNKTLEIYGGKGIEKNVVSFLKVINKSYYLEKKEFSNFKIEIKEINKDFVLEGKDYRIKSMETMHTIPSLAFSFILKEKNRIDKEKFEKLNIGNTPLVAELVKGNTVEINGEKISGKEIIYIEPSKKISIILDTKFDKRLIEFSKNSDILICESTYLKDEQEYAKNYGHMTTFDAATIAKDSKSKRLYITHLSQKISEIPKVVLKEAKSIFKNTFVAEDFDEIEL